MKTKLLCLLLFAIALHAQNPPVNATQLRGRNISTTAPTNGQVYEWDTATLTWKPATVSGGASPAGSAGCVDFTGNPTTAFDCDSANFLYVKTAIATPSAPTVTNQGTAGAVTYGYEVCVQTLIGCTLLSGEGTTATGNATLDAMNFNRIASPSTCATGLTYQVNRSTTNGTPATTGIIGTGTCGSPFDDTGLVVTADPYWLSIVNTTQGLFLNHVLRLPNLGDFDKQVYIGDDIGTFSANMERYTGGGLATFLYHGNSNNIYGGAITAVVESTGGYAPIGMTVAISTSDPMQGNLVVAIEPIALYSGTGNSMASYAAFEGEVGTFDGNIGSGYDFVAADATRWGSGTITNMYGYSCYPMTKGTTTNTCFISNQDVATGSWAFYGAGTAASHFGGQVEIVGLKTTGAATGKTVVCVDVATGQLYASTSGVACAN